MKIPLLSGMPWRTFESCILPAIHFSWGSEKEKLGIYVYISFRETAIIQVVKTLTVESKVDTNMCLHWTLILSSQRFWNFQKRKKQWKKKTKTKKTHITTFLKDRNMPNSLSDEWSQQILKWMIIFINQMFALLYQLPYGLAIPCLYSI